MFFEKLACMHECSRENFPADSTRVDEWCFFKKNLKLAPIEAVEPLGSKKFEAEFATWILEFF